MTPKKDSEKEPAKNDNGDSADNAVFVGYARMSRKGGALKISLKKDALNKCNTYDDKNDEEFIPLVIPIKHLQQVIDGKKEVTGINHLL